MKEYLARLDTSGDPGAKRAGAELAIGGRGGTSIFRGVPMGTRVDFARFAATAFDSGRFDKTRSDQASDRPANDDGNRRGNGDVGLDVDVDVDVDVGEGYYPIAPDLLIEKGDEYRHPSGRFIAFPLEAVGRPLAHGLLARRLSSRRATQR